MPLIRTKLARTLPKYWAQVAAVCEECGRRMLGPCSVAQLAGGLRGVRALVCDTSEVDPQRGLILRGHPVADLQEQLPEDVFWLLATGELPTAEELTDFQRHIAARQGAPAYIWELLEAAGRRCPPMTLLSMAVLAMQRESVYARRIWEKQQHRFWEFALEDVLNLIARVPVVAAGIYRLRRGLPPVPPRPDLDWAANYAQMLGLPETAEVQELFRRYMVVHSDHESGNATAYSFNMVASVLADPYTALSAGLNALAGPLHGAASQGSIEMIQELLARYSGWPSAEQVEEACWKRLREGKVIPGYGHAVLRVVDPRFLVLYSYGHQYFPDDPAFRVTGLLYQVAPRVLREHGRAANPYPNVDAITGAILQHYGIEDTEYYTVLFGVGLMLGLLAQYVLLQGGGRRIIRPRSVTSSWLRSQLPAGATAG